MILLGRLTEVMILVVEANEGVDCEGVELAFAIKLTDPGLAEVVDDVPCASGFDEDALDFARIPSSSESLSAWCFFNALEIGAWIFSSVLGTAEDDLDNRNSSSLDCVESLCFFKSCF